MDTCTSFQHFSSLLISSKVYLLSIIPHSDAVRPILVDSHVLFFSQSCCDFSFPSLELASPAPHLPFVILYMFWSFGLQEFHSCIPSIPHFPPWTLARMDCDAFFMDPQRTIDSVIAMYSFLMESTRGKIGKPRADGGFIDFCYIPLINASPQCQIWRTATIIGIYGYIFIYGFASLLLVKEIILNLLIRPECSLSDITDITDITRWLESTS